MPPKRRFLNFKPHGDGHEGGGHGGHSASEKERRRKNVALFQEALKISNSSDLKNDPPSIKQVFPEEISIYPTMNIIIEPVNCLDSVINYVHEFPSRTTRSSASGTASGVGCRVAMLNMASFSTPGGGVTRGSSAQEEALCRASNLYPSLVEARKFGFYPMNDGFVTQNVTFFRDASGKVMNQSKWVKCDIINLAALRFRTARDPEDLSQKEKNLMYNKIQEILVLGQGYDCLILSAFGCGAYHNPPEFVAEMFYELLVTENWGCRFQKVVFAIINDRNGRSNYEVFRDQFMHRNT